MYRLPEDGFEVASSDMSRNKVLAKQTTIHLRSLASRHVLVKDTAFQT